MRFTDVTDAPACAGVGYAMGAAAADYDNDGHVDLFVAGVRTEPVAAQSRRRPFEDVTARAGIASGDWAVAAGWFDYDNDGRLDLFVVNYVQWSPDNESLLRRSGPRHCGSTVIRDFSRDCRTACIATAATARSRTCRRAPACSTHVGKGMSVAFADYDHDGRLDVFVTNDTVPNFLFRNKGDGTFEETALLAGRLGAGIGPAGLGHGRRLPGLRQRRLGGHPSSPRLSGETFPLFRNDGRGAFVETTQASGLAALTAKSSGWCAVLADVDNDGWKDIFTANSHANDRIGESEATGWKQANSLFLNERRRAASATRRRKPVSPAPSPSTADAASPTSTVTAAWISSCWCSARRRSCGRTRRTRPTAG